MSDWGTEPHRLTPEELDTLARRIVTNEVFITNTAEGFKNSFGVLLMFASPPRGYTDRVGAMYEDWSKAGPRSINGFPFFTSGRFLHADDLAPLRDLVAAKTAALNASPLPTEREDT